MSQSLLSGTRRLARLASVSRLTLAICSATVASLAGPALAADGTFRLLTFNTWNERFRNDVSQMSNFFANGQYDIIAWQELRANSPYAAQVPPMLQGLGLGTYTSTQTGDTGITSRLSGTAGGVNGSGTQGNRFSFIQLDAQNMLPQTTVASVHFDYADESVRRVQEARNLLDWARTVDGPLIVTGDFNAGDVSERGLHHVDQQKLLLRSYLRSNNSFYYDLLTQYAVDRTQLDSFISTNNGRTLSNSDIPDTMFVPETYAVQSNTPQTMNLLKKQFILLQKPGEREQFAPHDLRDGSTTWPSAGEDATNTWPSWDRAKIDHILVSRPFGKWWDLSSDASNPYVGVLDQTGFANNGTTPLSDHELTAHDMRWVGPALQKYAAGQGSADKTRLVWGTEAAVFNEKNKVFYLTRNNMRTDLYLGQIADEDGMPLLTSLTLAEKKTLLDCMSKDPRFQQAIQDYCIDDHSFIGETLVKNGGTVIVDEDAALGGSNAQLRLADGRLRVAGTSMGELNRAVVLEGTGGAIDVEAAGHSLTIARTVSGSGSLTKEGAGRLNLTGVNTYTGGTTVAGGTLSVNGSIASSSMVTVLDGGTLGGTGTTGALRIARGGVLAPGNSIGTLNVNGDVTFDPGSVYRVEVDQSGNSDRLAATGTITINNSTLDFVPVNTSIVPQTAYTIFSAAGGISGTFGSVTSSYAFLNPYLTYTGNSISLQLLRNDVRFADVAASANGRAVAGAIDGMRASDPLFNALLPLYATTARDGFQQLSGEFYASMAGALAEESQFSRDAVTSRMRAPASGFTDGRWQPWMQSYGAVGRTGGDGLDTLKRTSGGVFFGTDIAVDSTTRLGVMGGYGYTHLASKGVAASADANSGLIGLYGATAIDKLRFTYGSTVSFSRADAERTVAFGNFANGLRAKVNGTTAQVFGEAAYAFDLEKVTLEPLAGLAHVHVRSGSFAESGGAAALSGSASGYDATFTTLGLRAFTDLKLGETLARVSAEAGWRHAFGSEPQATLAFDRGSAFSIEGAGVARDTAFIRTGVDVNLRENASLSLKYTGGFSSEGGTHGINAGVKIRF
ncbi:Extracellular serine protease precursor [Pannonibacter phragmitetus]|uniref:Extracellular serine protease n=1 Tax=Pannonibacter phragmitetus TaxID=121719 RepID=A0A378ZRF1_9HYPH|nr:autotransporter domain-containing protein [Pannonibacter phragmitetus]SUA99563.1 Extracellular serine protease precursor [Pannonibacter phragmitetus]